MSIIIKNINNNLEICLDVIRKSFTSVANDFNLNKKNAPTNPAFIELKHLIQMDQKGVSMFGAFLENTCIGFVGIKKAMEGTYWLEKLAVLPEYRNKGYGKELIDFVFAYVREHNGKRVSIGIINEHIVLKNWYLDYGFKEVEKKVFDHLPFTVCFMLKDI